MTWRWCFPLLGVLCVSLFAVNPAGAHGRSVSYSSWVLDADGAEVTVRLKLLELSRIGPEALPPGSIEGGPPPGAPDRAAQLFPSALVLLADGTPCPLASAARSRPDAPGWVRYTWRVACPTQLAGHLAIRSRLLLDVAPGHLHFARVRTRDTSSALIEQVLTENTPELLVRSTGEASTQEPSGSGLSDYLRLGIEHILSGWDHLAFLLGLLLLASRLGEVARLVTGFTLAHSLTLALTVLDVVHPRAAAVEAVIAFSVALVAIEKGWMLSGRSRAIPRAVLIALLCGSVISVLGGITLPVTTLLGLTLFTACYFALVERHSNAWLRVCLTFAFGLVHGFGFAGILMEMSLPTQRLVPALLGFNLGVELGQIGVVLALWPLIQGAKRWVSLPLRQWASELSAAALCGLGLYWFVERAISG